jgi:hypothetical protein
VSWTNQTQLVQIDNSNDLKFSWTGGDAQRETVFDRRHQFGYPDAFLCCVFPRGLSLRWQFHGTRLRARESACNPIDRGSAESMAISRVDSDQWRWLLFAQGLNAGFSIFGAWNAKSVVCR